MSDSQVENKVTKEIQYGDQICLKFGKVDNDYLAIVYNQDEKISESLPLQILNEFSEFSAWQICTPFQNETATPVKNTLLKSGDKIRLRSMSVPQGERDRWLSVKITDKTFQVEAALGATVNNADYDPAKMLWVIEAIGPDGQVVGDRNIQSDDTITLAPVLTQPLPFDAKEAAFLADLSPEAKESVPVDIGLAADPKKIQWKMVKVNSEFFGELGHEYKYEQLSNKYTFTLPANAEFAVTVLINATATMIIDIYEDNDKSKLIYHKEARKNPDDKLASYNETISNEKDQTCKSGSTGKVTIELNYIEAKTGNTVKMSSTKYAYHIFDENPGLAIFAGSYMGRGSDKFYNDVIVILNWPTGEYYYAIQNKQQ